MYEDRIGDVPKDKIVKDLSDAVDSIHRANMNITSLLQGRKDRDFANGVYHARLKLVIEILQDTINEIDVWKSR